MMKAQCGKPLCNDEVLSMGSLTDKFRAFGFDAAEIDGHDINALIDAFSVSGVRPQAVIANTVKGKGVSFMEGDPLWHNGKLNEEQFNRAIKEVEMGK